MSRSRSVFAVGVAPVTPMPTAEEEPGWDGRTLPLPVFEAVAGVGVPVLPRRAIEVDDGVGMAV